MQKDVSTPIEKKPYEPPTLQKRERLEEVVEGITLLTSGAPG